MGRIVGLTFPEEKPEKGNKKPESKTEGNKKPEEE